MKNTDSIAQKIRELYAITTELESLYPGRKFTIDGHLVGSIGEVLVAERYGLTLLPNSTQTHDAEAKDGRLVQIKATQTKRIAISSEPDFLGNRICIFHSMTSFSNIFLSNPPRLAAFSARTCSSCSKV